MHKWVASILLMFALWGGLFVVRLQRDEAHRILVCEVDQTMARSFLREMVHVQRTHHIFARTYLNKAAALRKMKQVDHDLMSHYAFALETKPGGFVAILMGDDARRHDTWTVREEGEPVHVKNGCIERDLWTLVRQWPD